MAADSLILVNRRASASAGTVQAALKRAGVSGHVELVDGADIARRSARAVRDRTRRVVIGGGDGSLSAAAGALAGSSTALAILPLGTRNHLARDAAIPLDLDGAARVLAGGVVRQIDVATVNGRVFVNNAAIGIYPLMVIDRESQQRRFGRSKRLALLLASLHTLARFKHRQLTLTVHGQPQPISTPLLFVGNNRYRLAVPGAGRRDRLDGGELNIVLLRSRTATGFLVASARALVGLAREDELTRLDGVRQLRVDSQRTHLAVAVDGETAHFTPPLDFRLRPKALSLIVPAEDDLRTGP